ncbi:MAG: leucyl/phenylalanyl-tRNA--protein transferase [Candidatus Nanopelagicales bacterium]
MALVGYRRGLFAMEVAAGVMGWFSPDPRGILRPGTARVSRSLRRSMRRFTVTVDTCFAAVVAACADPDRDGHWITDDYRAVYRDLHNRGLAHSVEVWHDGRLAGGLFGVEQGGLFCGESMFHHVTDASKAALVATDTLLADAGGPRLFDVQWWTPHLGSMGVIEIPRARYLEELPAALSLSAVLSP